MRSKIALFFSIYIMIVFLLSISPPVYAYETTYLYPVADAMIDADNPDVNYGSFIVNTLGSWDNNDRIGFFMFNMSDFDPDLESGQTYQYEHFYFQLYADYVYDQRDADNFFHYGFTNTSWSEMSITWNTSPSFLNVSEYVEITLADQYYSWDLTQIINDIDLEIQSDSDLTIVIKYEGSGAENLTQDFNARFREYGGVSFDPRMRIDFDVITAGYDYETEPSLSAFPIALADALHISQLGGELLASLVIALIFILPTAYASKDMKSPEIPVTVISLLVLSFLSAINYLPIWLLVLSILIIALLYASHVRGWIGGWRG